MERSNDHGDLAAALAEVRPTPRAAFTEELDERAAAGFPRRSRLDNSPLAAFAGWVRALSPQRLLFAGGTAALVAIAIATVVVASGNSGPSDSQPASGLLSEFTPVEPEDSSDSGFVPRASTHSPATSAAGKNSASGESANNLSFKPESRHREIERSAVIGLLATPADVAGDSAEIFAAVHDANGIVLSSTTSSGENAGAHFDLLIPSAKLGDALAAFSTIDEVRSRHEATDDITEPTVSAREELQDSKARIDALLAQLSAAETESEAEAVETELRGERRHAARLRARLANLDQRTTYSRVTVRIESGASADSGGTWGFDDAIGDAGRVLAVAAGVTLVGLAILAPLALIAFLAWLTHRLWLRTRRERALDA
jgi:Domain of unknown function (DUF4349)